MSQTNGDRSGVLCVVGIAAALGWGGGASDAWASGLPAFETRATINARAWGPGLGERVYADTLGRAVINNAGQIALVGDGIWSDGGGTGLTWVARERLTAPGLEQGVKFHVFGRPVLNEAGQTAFRGIVSGAQDGEVAIWSEGGGAGLALLDRTSVGVPGVDSGAKLSYASDPVFNDAGQAAFLGAVAGGDSGGRSIWAEGNGIWSEGRGSLELIARPDETAPGTESDFLGFGDPVINGSGRIAFRGRLSESGATLGNEGIWSDADGSGLSLVARAGGAAPGIEPDLRFYAFSDPAINDARQVAFVGSLLGPEDSYPRQHGVWMAGRRTGPELVVRSNQTLPGLGEQARFLSFRDPVINRTGTTAFIASMLDPDVSPSKLSSVWTVDEESGLKLIAQQGTQAPGTEPGSTFHVIKGLQLNAAGQVAFFANLNDWQNHGIWATDREGQLRLIAYRHQWFDINDDPMIEDLRRIEELSLITGSGNEDGRASSFNDLGQVVFHARFWGGAEGVFVSNLVAIPEPGSAVLLAFVVPLLLRRGRAG